MMYLGNNPVAISHTLNTGSGDFVDTDTKNTAGATDTSDKIFIVGAKTQDESPQTYTQDSAYVGADGCLYSNGQKVLTSHQDISGKAPLASPAFTGTPTAPTAASGTNTTQVATTAFVKNAIDNIPTGSSDIPFGVCTDSSSALTKTVTINGIESLHNGLRISVLFTNGNTVLGSLPGSTLTQNSLAINLNNLGAKSVLTHDTNMSGSSDEQKRSYGAVSAKQIVDFVYYNNNWYIVNRVGATNSVPGIVYLAPSIAHFGVGPRAISADAVSDWVDGSESNRVQICNSVAHDQYLCDLGINEYRCVFRFFFVNSAGETYYPVSPSSSPFDDIFSNITFNIYGYDGSGNGTLLESNTMDWYPPYTDEYAYGYTNSGVPDNQFAHHHGMCEYIYKFSSDLANTYDHLGGVVVIDSNSRLTMYHPSQDLSISLTGLTHNTVEFKNIGINISSYLNQLSNELWNSYFTIPNDAIRVAQNTSDFDSDAEIYTSPLVIGYEFDAYDFSVIDNGRYGAYSKHRNLADNNSRQYPIIGKLFLVPKDNALYYTDFRLCKKISMAPFVDATT